MFYCNLNTDIVLVPLFLFERKSCVMASHKDFILSWTSLFTCLVATYLWSFSADHFKILPNTVHNVVTFVP